MKQGSKEIISESPPLLGRLPLQVLLAGTLLILTVVVYFPIGNHQFLLFDDPVYVTDNIHVISGLTRENIVWAFTSFEGGNWNPVTWLSHMTDVQLYGMNPRGHHLTSLVFHTLSTLLLFMLFLRMTYAPWQSFFVAALFALHPMHVESVAWVAERKDALSAFFCFLSLYQYVRFTENRKTSRYLLALCTFIAGLMSKPMLVTLPVVMLLTDFWPGKRFSAEKGYAAELVTLVKEKIPFIICSIAAGIIAVLAQQSVGAVATYAMVPLRLRIENALIAYAKYCGKTLWPTDLAVYYPMPMFNVQWQVAAACVMLITISLAVVLARKRAPFLVTGWSWFIITLLPVIGLVQVGNQLMADRYSYIPGIGIFVMLAWGVPQLFEIISFRKELCVLCVMVVIGALLVLTRHQIGYWKDDVTLYRHALRVTSNNFMIHNNLGLALDMKGDLDGAIVEFQKAIRTNPNFKKAHNNLGLALAKKGDLDYAIREFQLALLIDPLFDDASNNLGVTLAERGYLNDAIRELHRAVKLDPNNSEVHFNLGLAYHRKGETETAILKYRDALRLNPRNSKARIALQEALQGR